ncbi:MAG: hypothetical protein JWN07_2677, partial [Hyphomicrobiales bacterium]|nr:hypothetical protein [Hyphomicrobiales bacterium]
MDWRAWAGKSGDRTTQGLPARLDALSRQAAAVLAWERIWPALVGVLSVIALFLAVSWAGVWLVSPRWLRMAGVAAFALLLAASLYNLARLRWPGRRESIARLDRDSGLAHRPATAIEDRLANDGADPATRALWQLHLERAARALSAIRVANPSPRMVEHDRYALRAGAVLLLAGAAFMAGPEKYPRVLAAFDWRSAPEVGQGFRLDAWIDPPPYTGRPPILLTSGLDKSGVSKPVQAPAGSNIVVRASANAGVTSETEGGLQAPPKPDPAKPEEATAVQKPPAKATQGADTEQRFVLRSDGKLRLKQGTSTLATFDIVSLPDTPPTITLRGEPKSNTRGALTLGYKVEDDYGIVSAEAQFSKPLISGRPVTGRSLVEAPKMALALPGGAGGLGEGETTGDLSEHPWAGARVTMTLVARDEGGNEGLSDPYEMTLPQRTFVKPLARALVEQRRNLILAPDDRRRVQLAIDTLMFAPEKFDVPSNIYLGLRTISQRLRFARRDPALLEVADLMWEMALRLEDGDLSQAERDLRAAQQQLREALDRGATPEELKRLMDQLRAALDKFVQELAEQQMRD